MPLDIIGGLITLVEDQLSLTAWDGEIPRQDTSGTDITPSTLPAYKIWMSESGFGRDWTLENLYSDDGEIVVMVWSTTRASVQTQLNNLESLLVKDSNHKKVSLGGSKNEIKSMLLTRWYNIHLEGIRTHSNELLYEGALFFDVSLNGNIDTI